MSSLTARPQRHNGPGCRRTSNRAAPAAPSSRVTLLVPCIFESSYSSTGEQVVRVGNNPRAQRFRCHDRIVSVLPAQGRHRVGVSGPASRAYASRAMPEDLATSGCPATLRMVSPKRIDSIQPMSAVRHATSLVGRWAKDAGLGKGSGPRPSLRPAACVALPASDTDLHLGPLRAHRLSGQEQLQGIRRAETRGNG